MIIYCLMCPRAKRGSSELKTLFCISCRQNCSNPISQAVNSVATSEPFCKPSSLQGSQSESCYQQPFLNAQCVPADRGSFGDLTQTHHLTNDGGLQQHNGHVSILFHNTLHMEGIYCKNHHHNLYLFQDQHQTISVPMEGLSPLILLAWLTKPILNTATKAMFTTTYNPQIQVELAIFHNILFPSTHHHYVQMLMGLTVEASVLATWHPRLNILQHPRKHHLTATVPRWLGLQHT